MLFLRHSVVYAVCITMIIAFILFAYNASIATIGGQLLDNRTLEIKLYTLFAVLSCSNTFLTFNGSICLHRDAMQSDIMRQYVFDVQVT